MSTIVVTGASAGIGLESALQLGADRHDLVLVGRHGVRLADAAEAVRAAGGIHVDTFTADFASLDSVRTLGRDLLELLELIDVLVDNAGTSSRGAPSPTTGSRRPSPSTTWPGSCSPSC